MNPAEDNVDPLDMELDDEINVLNLQEGNAVIQPPGALVPFVQPHAGPPQERNAAIQPPGPQVPLAQPPAGLRPVVPNEPLAAPPVDPALIEINDNNGRPRGVRGGNERRRQYYRRHINRVNPYEQNMSNFAKFMAMQVAAITSQTRSDLPRNRRNNPRNPRNNPQNQRNNPENNENENQN